MANQTEQLQRQVGLVGAVMMGLGSILGTGVFVSLGIGAGIAGPAVILAVMIGAGVAILNGLSSAQLAANHPVSGGTYEYGYRFLNPWLGFTAGWMFLLAKSASAATAALGLAGYLLNALGAQQAQVALVGIALATVAIVTVIVVSGISRSNQVNIFIVSVTLATLLFFVLAGLGEMEASNFTPFFGGEASEGNPVQALLYASALMFVAYTGYGRIATLGEEVKAPRVTIPRAIITAMILTMIIYLSVATVGVGVGGADTMYAATVGEAAPLEVIARSYAFPGAGTILAVGAMTAMFGVLLNLILGLSRVLLAMGRRHDMPAATGRLNAAGTTPTVAVWVMGAVVAALTLLGDVRVTWSFSAFTVLIYYALTNLAALQLSNKDRFYPRWLAWAGLAACLFLAFWVDVQIWLIGLSLIGVGLLWHWAAQRLYSSSHQD
jgi:APA family basic amino acid/polyamine antiporter